MAPPQRKFIILGMIAIATWYVFDKTIIGIILAVGTALFGCLVEISLIKSHLFYYYLPERWGIPLWLPFIYMTASVAIGNFGKKLFFEEIGAESA